MKKTHKRFIPLLLALSLSVAACGTGAASDEIPKNTTTKSNTTEDSNDTDETVGGPDHIADAIEFEAVVVDFPEAQMTYPVTNGGTVSMFISFSGVKAKYYTSLSESPTVKQWVEDTGIDIEFVHPPAGSDSDNFTLLASTDDLPDIIVNGRSYYPGGDVAAVNDGVFMDLTDLVQTNMPDYQYFLDNNDLFRKAATVPSGDVYSIYNYKDVQAPFYHRPQVRKDWMEEFGMEMLYTFDDWEAYFDKVLETKPGVSPFQLTNSGIEGTFTGTFEAGSQGVGAYFQTNGKVRYRYDEPGLKDYFLLMNKWWEKGYINPDFATTDMSLEDALVNGTAASVVANTDGVFTKAAEVGTEVMTVPYPRVNKWDPYNMDIFYFPQNGTPTNIAAYSENAELALQFLNYGYTREGSGVANFGETGVTWEMGDDGVPKFTDYALNQTEIPLSDVEDTLRLHSIWSKYRYGDDISMIRNVKNPETWDYRAKWGIGLGDDPTVDNSYALPGLSFTTEQADELASIQNNIDTYASEMALKFVIGDESLDNYDAFVDRLNQLGMQRLIEIHQEAYDTFLAK